MTDARRELADRPMDAIDRVRCALAMSDAGYKWEPCIDDVISLLAAYDALRSPPVAVGEEEIARALCKSMGLDWDAQADSMTSASGGDNEQECYREMARTVLALLATSGRNEVSESSCCQEDGYSCGPFDDQQLEIEKLKAELSRLRTANEKLVENLSEIVRYTDMRSGNGDSAVFGIAEAALREYEASIKPRKVK